MDDAERVRAWRESLGLTQVEIAERLGISARQWIRYERGEWPPKRWLRILMRLARRAKDLE